MKKLQIVVITVFLCQLAMAQLQIFDSHVHLWDGEQSLKTYLRQADSSGQTVTRFGGILIARKGEPLKTKTKNDELVALSKQNTQLVPICSVHPLDGEAALQEIRRLSLLGVKAIKLHPHTQQFDVTDERVMRLCKEAGKLGLVVLMDNASIKPGDCENLFDLAIKCSGTKFIFAHLGGFNFRFWNIIAVARTAKGFYKDNIYFDISAMIISVADSPVEDEFIWTMRNAGINNILFGSDFPQYTLKQAIDALDRLELKQEEKENILFDNARKLLFP